jgi:hypothetical protein
MKGIPYASAVGSLMYAQTCTRPDIAYAVGLLGRYQRHGACLQSNEVSSGDQRLNDHITAIRYTGDRRIFGLRLRWVPGHQEIDIRIRLPACRRRHFVEE